MQILHRFLSDEEGATSIEYAIMALILGVGIIAAIQDLPTKISALVDSATKALSDASSS
jgi:Flp pilus assembly pilin Flp